MRVLAICADGKRNPRGGANTYSVESYSASALGNDLDAGGQHVVYTGRHSPCLLGVRGDSAGGTEIYPYVERKRS